MHLFRARRKELGLTQVEAARHAGVAVPTWIRMEAGHRCTPSTRAAVATALGWSVDAYDRLLTGDDPAALTTSAPGPLSGVEGIEQMTAIMQRMDLSADQIDIIVTLVRRLLEHP